MHSIEPYKNDIVRRMFIETADLNYVGARAAFFEQRHWDFWWLTLHAVEKYLKSTLLLNGMSAKVGGHNLHRLLEAVYKLDTRLTVPAFHKPKISGLSGWPTALERTFVSRLNEFGSADNRYGAYGYTLRTADLLLSDQLIYWARRHAQPLKTKMPSGEEIDWVNALASNDRLWLLYAGPLEDLARLPFRNPRRWPLTRLNAAFFPDIRHRISSLRLAFHNAPIAMWCDRLRESQPNSQPRQNARAVIRWALDHIVFTKIDKRELEDILRSYPSV